MIRLLPAEIEPSVWYLAFHRRAARRWIKWLACGRYAHVSAFCFVRELECWLLYDVTLTGTRIVLMPACREADRRLAEHVDDADLLTMPVQPRAVRWSFLASFYCVPAIKHLIGLSSGALRPQGLYRDCLANGGKPVDGSAEPTPDANRPDDPLAAATGRG